MATLALTIGGVSKTLEAGSLHISKTANGIATATFNVISTDGSYRPAADAEVILTLEDDIDPDVIIFAGLAQRPEESGIFSNGALAGIRTRVSCVDFNAYADRRLVNGVMPAGTLKDQLIIIQAYIGWAGVTLDAGQVDGPSIQQLEHTYVKATEVLNELMTLTAEAGMPYVWRIDNNKVLSAYQPSTELAPFDILSDSPPEVVGDIQVMTTREHYANVVYVLPSTITGPIIDFGLAQDAGEIASVGYVEKLVRVEKIESAAAAQARADAELASALALHQTVKYSTYETGLEPGMAQTITVPKRNVNATGLISDVVIRDIGPRLLRSDVTVVIDSSQTNLKRNWRDTIKQWSNVSLGAGVAATPAGGGGGGGAGGPGGPDNAVQYNANGAFGGDAEFTYDAETNSLVCGEDSDITAADPQSCFVFGSDCHITD